MFLNYRDELSYLEDKLMIEIDKLHSDVNLQAQRISQLEMELTFTRQRVKTLEHYISDNRSEGDKP